MKHTKALTGAAFIAAFLLLTGCIAPRELAYRTLQVRELEHQVLSLKDQLMAGQAMKKDDPWEQKVTDLGGEVTWRDGELVIGIKGDILFKPGSNKLSGADRANLRQIVELIKGKYPNNFLRVEGHTDSDPVVRHKDKWDNNWDLSGGRSRAVLEYMVNRCGISSKKIYFAGMGEHRPKASNSSKAGKARNRRVEIVVIPQQRP